MDLDKMTQEFLRSQTAGWLQEDSALIKENFYLNKLSIAGQLAENIAKLLRQAEVLEQKGRKGTAAYLCISFLYTNVLENIWQYRLDVYDKNFLFDQTECCGNWSADFVFAYLNSRLENLSQKITGGIYANKVRQHQLNSIKLELGLHYHIIATLLTKKMTGNFIEILKNNHNTEISHLKIMMGEYKDFNFLLYKPADS
ncbi:MAG: hypothetical protein LBR56_03575 [Sporomusaceae bacterium]|jgi:hypothetical protein|nr:hypothetical protein [Sporomusaceae bacterium]